MWIRVLVVVLLAFATQTTQAPVTYIKTRVIGSSEATETEQWLSGQKAALKAGDRGLVVDLDKKVTYDINHAARTYARMKVPPDFYDGPKRVTVTGDTGSFEGYIPGEFGGVQWVSRDQFVSKILSDRMLDVPRMDMSAQVRRAGVKKRIGTWDCDGYDVTLLWLGRTVATGRIWASTAFQKPLLDSASRLLSVLMQGEMRWASTSEKELRKINGVYIASEWNPGYAHLPVRTEVVEIADVAAPEGIFGPPSGYVEVSATSTALRKASLANVDDVIRAERARPRATTPIKWETDARAAFKRAKEEARLVIADFWSSSCKPCRVMDEWVWTDAEVAAAIDARLVGLKINTDRDRTTPQRLQVAALPTVIVADPGGKELLRFVGYRSSKEVLALLASVK